MVNAYDYSDTLKSVNVLLNCEMFKIHILCI